MPSYSVVTNGVHALFNGGFVGRSDGQGLSLGLHTGAW